MSSGIIVSVGAPIMYAGLKGINFVMDSYQKYEPQLIRLVGEVGNGFLGAGVLMMPLFATATVAAVGALGARDFVFKELYPARE